MNIRAIGFYIGHILRIEGVLLVPALLIALFCHERESLHAFGITILILAVLSMALLSLGRRGPFWKRRVMRKIHALAKASMRAKDS